MLILEFKCWNGIKYSWVDDFEAHQRPAELNGFGFYKTTSQAKNKKEIKHKISTETISPVTNKILHFKMNFILGSLSRNHLSTKKHTNLFYLLKS